MPHSGEQSFRLIWVGQLISAMGSGISRFALPLWAWQETGSATALAYIGLFSFAPLIFFSPLAGALVDRWQHRLKGVMLLSDIGGLLAVGALLLLYQTGQLGLGWIYLVVALRSLTEAFQWPAYSKAISVMLPKNQYARASGLQSLWESGSSVLSPLLGAVLFGALGLRGALALDLITFIAAFFTLLMAKVPTPKQSLDGRLSQSSLWQESLYGFRYIWARPSLLGIQLSFLALNLLCNMFYALQNPMILARSGGSEGDLAMVRSAAGLGALLGSFLISAWGGPRQKIRGVILGWAGVMLSVLCTGLGQGVLSWVYAIALGALITPFISASSQAIWQAKVPPDVQGKVFAARRFIGWGANPLAIAIAGPLADNFFNPAMLPGGLLSPVFGGMVGTGPGAGISLMFVLIGALGTCLALGTYLVRVIRDAEQLLPDYARTTAVN
jgi:MFS family permease